MNPTLERGLLLYQQSRYELAETELRQALAADPHDAYGHALLALCLARREQFKDATAEAEQAVHLAPDFAFAHYALAHVWHDRNHPEPAFAAVNEALRLDSARPAYFALLANIHLGESQWREALAAAERGLELDAEDITCTNLRAIALVKLGRKSEAGATIDAALRRNPDNAVSHANQGWTYLEKNDPKRALEHFREALRLEPENEWARRGIIEALKARHFIYAWMLRYFLFMGKLGRRGQWGIILGAYFGNQVLRGIAAASPALAPWATALRVVYLVFALMTWIASPLFNLMLRLNRFGRLVLSREEIIASNWIGLILLLGLLSLAGCAVYGIDTPWIMAAAIFGFLLLPVAGVFRCPEGTSRNLMTAYAAATAAAGLAAMAFFFFAETQPEPEAYRGIGGVCLLICILAAVISSWIVNLVITRRRRR